MVAADDYIRVCPVCGAENAPTLARCICGASLAGVDFSRAPAPDAAPAVAPESKNDAGTISTFSAPVICPHADCGQANPAGTERCLYCDRPLAEMPLSSPAATRPLPAALHDKYRVVEAFPASGAEADLVLVANVETGERCVAKLYRGGIKPDFQLLEVLAATAGDWVVRLIDYGVSEGIAYEVLEYIPHGTLQHLLESGPLGTHDVRLIVEQIAAALNGIHAHRILHRDLKPGNILLRSKAPLKLALTDFGIASLSEATQHFTSTARTTKYAAPEALTGVIDEKSDWWSLGMIVLEAASGRHPFDGLSEQVMSHHLATRPIDVRAVYDDDVRRLCRGLLLRDPKRRWGSAEVGRWLNGDPTLAEVDDVEGPASALRPYRIGAAECTTAAELALALAKDWDAARKDLARGQITRWVEEELRDYNLVRKLRDIHDYRGISDDGRLLRFLIAAAPDLPPVWRGVPVTAATLVAAARRADDTEEDSKEWLASLFQEDVLTQFAAATHSELHKISRLWRQDWDRFLELWDVGRNAEEAWRKQPRPVAGLASADVVSFDDLVYTQSARLAPPAARAVHGALLLAQLVPDYVAALREGVIGELAKVTDCCSWIAKVWEQAEHDPVAVIVTHRMLPRAREDAELEVRRQTTSREARTRIIAGATDELRTAAGNVLGVAPDEDEDLDLATVSRLLAALAPLQEACQKALALGYVESDYEALRRSAETLSAYGSALQHALARCEKMRGISAIFMQPDRLLIGAGLLVVLVLVIRIPWLILLLLLSGLIWGVQRWYAGFEANTDAASKLGMFRRYAKTFLRGGPASDNGQ